MIVRRGISGLRPSTDGLSSFIPYIICYYACTTPPFHAICNDYGRLGSIGVDSNAVQYDFFDP
jgi:hypothetical protein